ncbi:Glutamyl-tRNA [Spathaspora sp. JA1]|nr:Glutamyl-tRNA [Spathaspora sp. JA1]
MMCKHILRLSIRRYSTNKSTYLTSKEQIDQFLSKPTWSVKQLMKPNQDSINQITIDSNVIRKMLTLSGLKSDITSETEQQLINALKLQMIFIGHLYNDNEMNQEKESSNDSIFRLIASDHKPDTPVTLESLLHQIKNLPQQVNPEKGETEGFPISEINPRNDTFFTIKTKKSI